MSRGGIKKSSRLRTPPGGSILADRLINESVTDLPSEVVIGAVTRDREFTVPRGGTIIKPGDHVVLFVRPRPSRKS
jgi:Trk K+ transport system NAD-binding subunit